MIYNIYKIHRYLYCIPLGLLIVPIGNLLYSYTHKFIARILMISLIFRWHNLTDEFYIKETSLLMSLLYFSLEITSTIIAMPLFTNLLTCNTCQCNRCGSTCGGYLFSISTMAIRTLCVIEIFLMFFN